MLTRAETKVKEMHQTVDSLKNETKKLEVISFISHVFGAQVNDFTNSNFILKSFVIVVF